MRLGLLLATFGTIIVLGLAQDGAQLFDTLCLTCHEPGTHRDKSAESVLRALESGPMLPVTARRAPLERRAIAEFASGKRLTDGFQLKPVAQATCGVDPGMTLVATPTLPGITTSEVPRLKLNWAFAFPGEVNSDAALTVAAGRLFAGSRSGLVYSLEAASGCIHWIFQAESAVLTSITVIRIAMLDLAFFADSSANVYAINAANGKIAWRAKADSRLNANSTGSPAYSNGRILIPTSGGLTALDTGGRRLWQSEAATPVSTPVIDQDRNAAYAATNSGITAFALDTGKVLWSKSGIETTAPLLLVGSRLLVPGARGSILALDVARQGAALWESVPQGFAIGGAMAADAQTIYAGLSAPGAVPGGGLLALRLSDGRLLWKAAPGKCGLRPRCTPAQSQGITAIPWAVFSGSADGHLRAYHPLTGNVLWNTDTRQTYETINGVAGRGGSLSGPAPVVAGGMVYVNSGSALADGTPGNVLLAFSVDGK